MRFRKKMKTKLCEDPRLRPRPRFGAPWSRQRGVREGEALHCAAVSDRVKAEDFCK